MPHTEGINFEVFEDREYWNPVEEAKGSLSLENGSERL